MYLSDEVIKRFQKVLGYKAKADKEAILVSKEAILQSQLKGWIFESHLWDITGKLKEEPEYPMICSWCGAKAVDDTELEEGKTNVLCTKNPAILKLFKEERKDDNSTREVPD